MPPPFDSSALMGAASGNIVANNPAKLTTHDFSDKFSKLRMERGYGPENVTIEIVSLPKNVDLLKHSDVNSGALLKDTSGLVSDLSSRMASLSDEKIHAVAAFLDALEGNDLAYVEPAARMVLSDDPKFREFVKDNLWSDRQEKGWLRKTDVFDFIRKVYASYLGHGLARSSWQGLDAPLMKRISQVTSDSKKNGIHLPNGIPDDLHLPLREEAVSSDPNALRMFAMQTIHKEVAAFNSRKLHKSNAP